MTEFKEKIYVELLDELYQNISSASYGPAGIIAVEPPALKRAIRQALLEKLNSDCIIIDRNKLKEKLEVKDYPPFHNDDFNPNVMFVTGLRVRQYFDELTIARVDIDILKDRVKDGFIYKLEECDFE